MKDKPDIPTPDFVQGLSEEGVKNFEREVLNGSLFRDVIQSIEDAALAGYTETSRTFHSTETKRALGVIRKNLQAAGYYCEFGIQTKLSYFGEYKEPCFVIKWSAEN